MELEMYKTIAKLAEAEIIEKKSRFIACVAPAADEDAARGFIAGIKKLHYDANHNVYAFITGLGKNNEIPRQSDDGEPAGAAGIPALNAIKAEGLTNTVAVVTRYFGGTLLGAGGLARAYGKAVKEAISAAGIAEMKLYGKYRVSVAYSLSGKFQFEYSRENFRILETVYNEAMELTILVEAAREPRFLTLTADLSAGKAKVSFLERVYDV